MFRLILLVLIGGLLLACNQEEKQAWDAAYNQNTIEAIDTFLTKYPTSSYKTQAIAHKEALLWTFAQDSHTEYHYKRYINLYPQGQYIEAARTQLDSLKTDLGQNIDLAFLTSKRFVGTINYGHKELNVISLKFERITQNNENIHFVARINTDDTRKDIGGTISQTDYTVSFEEQPEDQILLNLSPGKIYERRGDIFLESTDPQQYWRMR